MHGNTTKPCKCVHPNIKIALPPVPATKRLEGTSKINSQKLDKTSTAVSQPKRVILQWNANGIYREIQLLEDLAEKHKADLITIQESRFLSRDKAPGLSNYYPVRKDKPVQVEAREGELLTYMKKTLSHKLFTLDDKDDGALEKLSVQIPSFKQQTVISNWYLPLENSPFLQQVDFSIAAIQPEIHENEVICADLNAHNDI